MTRLSFALLLLLAAPHAVSGAKAPPRLRRTADVIATVEHDSENETVDEVASLSVVETRNLKEDGSGGAVADGLIEQDDCAPLAGVSGQAGNSFTDDECRSNGGCGGGCCRVYNYLTCDTSNSLRHLQCVCNSNTRTVGMFNEWTVTSGGVTQTWTPTGSEYGDPAALAVRSGNGGSSQGQGQVSSAFGVPESTGSGGGTIRKGKNDKKKDKSKDESEDGGNSLVSSSLEAPGFSGPTFTPYVSPNGAQVIGIKVTPGSPPAPAPPAPGPVLPATLVNPAPNTTATLVTPAPATPATATVTLVTVVPATQATPAPQPEPVLLSAMDSAGTSDTESNSQVNSVTTPAGTTTGNFPASVSPAANACETGAWYWNEPAFENFITCKSTSDDCNQAAGECCLASFCLCGRPGDDIEGRCIPSYDLGLLRANNL